MSKINNVIYDEMGQFIRFHSIGSNFRKASILHHQALVQVQELQKKCSTLYQRRPVSFTQSHKELYNKEENRRLRTKYEGCSISL